MKIISLKKNAKSYFGKFSDQLGNIKVTKGKQNVDFFDAIESVIFAQLKFNLFFKS